MFNNPFHTNIFDIQQPMQFSVIHVGVYSKLTLRLKVFIIQMHRKRVRLFAHLQIHIYGYVVKDQSYCEKKPTAAVSWSILIDFVFL